MSDLRELYQELILDHSRKPRNFRSLPEADRTAEGYNPNALHPAAPQLARLPKTELGSVKVETIAAGDDDMATPALTGQPPSGN